MTGLPFKIAIHFYNILCAVVVVTGNNICDNPNVIAPNFMEVFISFGQLEDTCHCGDADRKKRPLKFNEIRNQGSNLVFPRHSNNLRKVAR